MILADGFMKDYNLLDIGCGTAGYFRLLKNYQSIMGLDYSQKMIKAAERLMSEWGLRDISFWNDSFEKFTYRKIQSYQNRGVR